MGAAFADDLPLHVIDGHGDRHDQALPIEHRIPRDLPAYIQHGMPSPAALDLMLSGVRSRRLATTVADQLGADDPTAVRSRLRQMTVDQWREAFVAAPTELKDLLSIIQDPSLPPVARLLAGETVYLPLIQRGPLPLDGTQVTITPNTDMPEPHPWIIKVEQAQSARSQRSSTFTSVRSSASGSR
ncbi:MAG: hypothetical protein M3Q82_04320 [Actinomycetota bacterium]|nr:hypothetical protein [Actinomycetota bacterium]